MYATVIVQHYFYLGSMSKVIGFIGKEWNKIVGTKRVTVYLTKL